jgi:hypothetical protein
MEGGVHWIGVEDAATDRNIEEEEDLWNGGVGAERDSRAAPRWCGYSSLLWQANQRWGAAQWWRENRGKVVTLDGVLGDPKQFR